MEPEEEVKRQFDSHHASSSSSSASKNNRSAAIADDDASFEVSSSPTSVADINVFDEVSYKMQRMGLESIGEDGNNNSSTNDDSNNSSSKQPTPKRTLFNNERKAGPIDIDTCSPPSPRSQKAMNEHLRKIATNIKGDIDRFCTRNRFTIMFEDI